MSRFTVSSLFFAFMTLTGMDASALTLGQVAQTAQLAQKAAFQSFEMVAFNVEDRVPQWNRAEAAIAKDKVALQACLDSADSCQGTAMQAWRQMILVLQDQTAETKVQWVNKFFNRWQYRADAETYGVSEYWASPVEFMANAGDCEDYAIAKYVTLSFLGFSDDQMRVMAVVDNNRGGIGHSVLSVTLETGTIILDNLADRAYADHQQTGYAPRFAVNQTGIYTYAQQPRVILASME